MVATRTGPRWTPTRRPRPRVRSCAARAGASSSAARTAASGSANEPTTPSPTVLTGAPPCVRMQPLRSWNCSWMALKARRVAEALVETVGVVELGDHQRHGLEADRTTGGEGLGGEEVAEQGQGRCLRGGQGVVAGGDPLDLDQQLTRAVVAQADALSARAERQRLRLARALGPAGARGSGRGS